MKKSKNLLVGKTGILIGLAVIIIFLSGFFIPVRTRNIIWTIFFFAYGILTIWNANRTKKLREKVSGSGFILAGILAILNIFLIINISWNTLWLIAIAIIFASYLIPNKT